MYRNTTEKSFANTQALCEEMLQKDWVRNMAIRVGYKDSIWLDAFCSNGFPVDENTLFDMASVSKILSTTSLALMAFDRGLLHPDTLVSDYYEVPDDRRNMTIRNLMTHTMGLGHKNLCDPANTSKNIASYILQLPLDIEIGSGVLYSCPGYILLGKILERIYDMPLDRAFARYVTQPLGMQRTGYGSADLSNTVNSNMTEAECGLVNDYNCRYLGGVCGNAGVYSCMDDMTKYIHMLLRDGEPLIRWETLDMASVNYTPHLEMSRGLGFVYADDRHMQTADLFPEGSIGHEGHTGQSFFVDRQSGLYAVILSDMTHCNECRNGTVMYDDVKSLRNRIHHAIKMDLDKLLEE